MTSTTTSDQKSARTSGRVPTRPALRLGPISTVWRPYQVIMVILLAVATLLTFAIAIGQGDYPMSVPRVLRVLFMDRGSRLENLVVFDWRMPRALTAVLVGAALGLSGALTQAVTRNSLASPDILGITTGASAMAVTIIVVGGGTGVLGFISGLGLSLAALVGALLTALVIWLLAFRQHVDTFRLVLFGIVISALLQAYISYLLIQADINDAATAKFWLSGSLATASWERLTLIYNVVLVCLPLLLFVAYSLRALQLGTDTASALGQNVNWTQLTLLGMAVILAATSVSTAGPIGFVAFVAPQAALRLLRVSSPPLVASALMGAVLLQLADIVVQMLPVQLPVGLVTSPIGGLFLIYLLISRNRKVTS